MALLTLSKSIEPVLVATSEPSDKLPALHIDSTSRALSTVGLKVGLWTRGNVTLNRVKNKWMHRFYDNVNAKSSSDGMTIP